MHIEKWIFFFDLFFKPLVNEENEKYFNKFNRIKFTFFFPGAIIFGSDQEVAGVMRAVRRNNATGAFSWIGSDGWSARNLVSDGNEPEVKN